MKTIAVIKHRYTRGRKGKDRALAHVRYIAARPGPDKGTNGTRLFFDGKRDAIAGSEIVEKVDESFQQDNSAALLHKLVVSPGFNGLDMEQYTRELMAKLGRYKGLELDWAATIHKNTDHDHAHVVVLNRDKNGTLVRFDKHEYQLLREWGDKILEREIEPLDRAQSRTIIEAPEDISKMLDDRYYQFGDRKFQDLLKELRSPDTKDEQEELAKLENASNKAEKHWRDEQERLKDEKEDEEKRRRQIEIEESARLLLKFQEECGRAFERRRHMGPQQRLHENRGRLVEWHERYETHKMRERLFEQLAKDPERAEEIKKQLEWLDGINDSPLREPVLEEPGKPDEDQQKPHAESSKVATESDASTELTFAQRMQLWESNDLKGVTDQSERADEEALQAIVAKLLERGDDLNAKEQQETSERRSEAGLERNERRDEN